MRILVTGSSGLVGSSLISLLEKGGHDVFHLVRHLSKAGNKTIVWEPDSGKVDLRTLDGFEVVLHLAGKNLASRRWSKKVKKELFQSRCRDTWLLAQSLARLSVPPKVVLTASAVGYYGDRGEETVDESSTRGDGFLSDLCDHWERATEVIEQNGTRVVHARFGAILTPNGGMLKQLKFPFKYGLGTVLGSGKQWMSWVGLDDALRAIVFLSFSSKLRGAVNVCTDHPVRNEEFTYALAHALCSKARWRIPKIFLEILLGEVAREVLLASTKVKPAKLIESNFAFKTPTLQQLFPAVGWN